MTEASAERSWNAKLRQQDAASAPEEEASEQVPAVRAPRAEQPVMQQRLPLQRFVRKSMAR